MSCNSFSASQLLKKIAKKGNINPINLAAYLLKNMSYNTSKKILKFADKIFKFESDAILPGQIDLDTQTRDGKEKLHVRKIIYKLHIVDFQSCLSQI